MRIAEDEPMPPRRCRTKRVRARSEEEDLEEEGADAKTLYGVTVKRELSLLPNTSGKYVSSACAGATKKAPGVVACA